MKDNEARARILVLESALRTLPNDMAKAIHKDLAPMMERFNHATQIFNAAVKDLEQLDALAKRVDDVGELLEVLESDGNAVRVDVNALRNTVAGATDVAMEASAKVSRIVAGILEIGKNA